MASKAKAACDKVSDEVSAMIPKMKDVSKTLNDAHQRLSGISRGHYIGQDDEKLKNEYYDREKSNLQNIVKQHKIDLANKPDQLKRSEINAVRYDIFGDPNATQDEIKQKLSTYTGSLQKNYQNISSQIGENAIAHHKNYEKDLLSLLTHYKSQEVYSQKMQDLLTIKKQEKADLEDELEKITKIGQVDNRKALYETIEVESLRSTRKIMFYLYYIIFVIYLIFGNFFSNKEYRNIKVWIAILLYLTLPFYIKFITNGIIYLYRQVMYIKDNKLPKNVYTDL